MSVYDALDAPDEDGEADLVAGGKLRGGVGVGRPRRRVDVQGCARGLEERLREGGVKPEVRQAGDVLDCEEDPFGDGDVG